MIICEEEQFVHMNIKATFGWKLQLRIKEKVRWIIICNVAAYLARYKHIDKEVMSRGKAIDNASRCTN